MEKDVTIVRIYLNESDQGRRRTLMEEILNMLQDQHQVHGVTVFRGIAGFGSRGSVHASDVLRLMVDLPIIVEFYDEPEVVKAAIALLNGLVPSDHIVYWQASCPRFDVK
jgi:uncharacterized protein